MKRIVITESQYKRLLRSKNLDESFGTTILGDLTGDALRAAGAAFPLVGDIGVAVPAMIKNLKEIKDGTKELESYMLMGADEKKINKGQTKVVVDLIDLLQSFLEAIPDPGISEIVSFMSSATFNTYRVLGQDLVLKLLSKDKKIVDYLLKMAEDDILSKLVGKELNPSVITNRALVTLKKSVKYIEDLSTEEKIDPLDKLSDKMDNLGSILGGE